MPEYMWLNRVRQGRHGSDPALSYQMLGDVLVVERSLLIAREKICYIRIVDTHNSVLSDAPPFKNAQSTSALYDAHVEV